MDLRSSSRSSRSRSKTPFNLLTEADILKENHVETEQSFSKSTRSTTIIRTGNGSSTFDSIKEEISKSQHAKPSSNKRITRSSKFHKTSDYSSEDGENEVLSSRRYLSDNDRNRLLEDSRRASTEESAGNTALGLYRRAKRYWDEYPKTDWTYSPFSKDRVELEPGVVAMPNMSRRHLSTYDKYVSTSTQASLRPQKLFLENEESSESTSLVLRYIRKILFSIVMVFVGIFYLSRSSVTYVCKSSHSFSIKLAKFIHRLASFLMLTDTWLLKKRRKVGKTTSLLILCMVPLVLFAGFHLYLVSGISVAPSCHPNCGKIASDYLKTLTNDIFNIFKTS